MLPIVTIYADAVGLFGGMIIGQFMAILDIQIVASSLVQIQSGIGATNDEIAWIQTIYLLAEVVIMPLTAYLTKMWGTRLFYVIACVGFVLTSVGTGLSSSVGVMIGFRALQGLGAGVGAIAAVSLVTMLCFWLTPVISKLLGRIGMTIIVRVLGLILCALAIQFMLSGLSEAIPGMFSSIATTPYPAGGH